jgi:hypothetical protein
MSEFSHPAIGAALSAAATLLGMEAVFIGGLTDDTFTFVRTQGRWRGVAAGDKFPRGESLCARMLEGAPVATSDAANDAHYASAGLRERLGITSYVGVPLRNEGGALLGTLCGVDRRSVPVDGVTLATLRHLATTVAMVVESSEGGPSSDHPSPDDPSSDPPSPDRPSPHRPSPQQQSPRPIAGGAGAPVTIARTPRGWHVSGVDEEFDDLTTAMVLADLLAKDLSGGPRPPKPSETAGELERLRVAVAQLEHALAARVVIEQAIGVVAERFGIRPRDAFEMLRRSSRTAGRRVYDVARELTLSVVTDVSTLPVNLRRPQRP